MWNWEWYFSWRHPLLLGSLGNRVFERRTATGREHFACQDSGVSQIFILIIFKGENILSDVNVVEWRHVKRENSSLPVAIRVSKTCVLKLPNNMETRTELAVETMTFVQWLANLNNKRNVKKVCKPSSGPHSLFAHKHKNILLFLFFWLFFLQTRKHCVQVPWHYCQQSGREKEFSGLCESISVYLQYVWIVGSRKAATVISLWFAELDCDRSIHNWPVRMK